MSEQHTTDCRAHCTVNRSDTELLHELLERVDRIARVAEAGAQLLGPMLRGRLAKMAGAKAVARVQAEWRADERE